MRFIQSFASQAAKMADEGVISLPDLWIRANTMCGCTDRWCNIEWKGGCSGKAEVDYTSDGRVLRVSCLDCDSTIMRVVLPEHAMECSGSNARLMAEVKCSEPGCTEVHGIVLQQTCHPHAGKVVRYYKNRDYFTLVCVECDTIASCIHVGTPAMMATVEREFRAAAGRATKRGDRR